ncbi:NnrU family protein [Maricaulis sp. CAU 1757]
MAWLIAGLVLFLGPHLVRVIPGVRPALLDRLGPGPYRGLYSLVTLAGFALIVFGMIQAHPGPVIWSPPVWTRHVAFLLVPLGLILLVSAYAPGHIRHTVRHPMLAGVILWSGAHLLANGELHAMVLFGSFFVWSLVTFISAWMRETPPPVIKGWGGDLTAIILGVLAALILMNVHMYLFGVAIIG